jgi:hypothetical protein
MRLRVTALYVAVLLGALALSMGPARAQAWTKIDCGGGHVLAPPGLPAECYNGPEDTGGAGTAQPCRYFKYSVTLPANTGGKPRYWVQLRQSSSARCGLVISAAPATTIQHVAKFVEDEGTNWSAVQALDTNTNAMFFDAKNQKREGRCFGFTRLGPLVNATAHAYTLIGFFCNAPGQALDASAALALVNAVGIKS